MLEMYFERILVIDIKANIEGVSLLADQFMQLSHMVPLLLQKSGYFENKFEGVGNTSNEV